MIKGSSKVVLDTASPRLRHIAAQVRSPRALMAAVGKRVEKDLRAHFTAKDQEGNAKGWTRSHFWNRAVRRATMLRTVTDKGAEVVIASRPFVHKLLGGTVKPKRGKFLAIPVTARAKAAGSPREGGISGLFVIGRRGGRGRYLAIKDGGAIRIMYRLLPSVTHKPDPTALPPEADIRGGIELEAQRYWARELARGGAK